MFQQHPTAPTGRVDKAGTHEIDTRKPGNKKTDYSLLQEAELRRNQTHTESPLGTAASDTGSGCNGE